MNERGESSSAARVVVLAGRSAGADPWLTGLDQKGPSILRVEHPYDAAAELLAGPASALVLRLESAAGRSAGLVRLARRLGVEVLGVGAVPRGLRSDELSGVRLVGQDELPELLGAPGPGGTGAQAEPTPQAESATAGNAPSPPNAPPPRGPQENDRSRPDSRRTAQDASPADLLSAEELSALLGDQR